MEKHLSIRNADDFKRATEKNDFSFWRLRKDVNVVDFGRKKTVVDRVPLMVIMGHLPPKNMIFMSINFRQWIIFIANI